MLKQFKIITLAPTCFGSRRNRHQGTVLCLAKYTKYVFYARRYRRSQCYGGISACCAGVRFTVETVPIDARCKYEYMLFDLTKLHARSFLVTDVG